MAEKIGLKKITVRACGFTIAELPRFVGKTILRVWGKVVDLIDGGDIDRPWTKLRGRFQAKSYRDGVVYVSNACILPASDEATLIIAASRDAKSLGDDAQGRVKGSVDFVLDIQVCPGSNGRAYGFVIEPVLGQRKAAPLDDLLALTESMEEPPLLLLTSDAGKADAGKADKPKRKR